MDKGPDTWEGVPPEFAVDKREGVTIHFCRGCPKYSEGGHLHFWVFGQELETVAKSKSAARALLTHKGLMLRLGDAIRITNQYLAKKRESLDEFPIPEEEFVVDPNEPVTMHFCPNCSQYSAVGHLHFWVFGRPLLVVMTNKLAARKLLTRHALGLRRSDRRISDQYLAKKRESLDEFPIPDDPNPVALPTNSASNQEGRTDKLGMLK